MYYSLLFATIQLLNPSASPEHEKVLDNRRTHKMFAKSSYVFDRFPSEPNESSSRVLSKVSETAETVELDDGSIWQVSLYDCQKVFRWNSEETVSITQNTRWFSNSAFRLINRKTGASADVNLVEGPIKDGMLTNYVSKIDLSRQHVTLNSHSGWKIHPESMSIVENWNTADSIPIIIGDNSARNPTDDQDWEYVLIDVRNPSNIIQAHQIF
jgi:hypothetical protein